MAPAANEDDPVLHDALGLPPRLPNFTANTGMMGTAGDDEDGHWRNDFEPEEYRRPRAMEPSTPLQTGNEESLKTYAEVDLFLTAIEEAVERAGLQDKLHELAINEMSSTLATSYRRLSATKFPGLPPTYARLVEAMVESVALGKPEGHLLKEIRTLEFKKMGVWPLGEQLNRMYQTYLALCRRTHNVPVIIEQIVVGVYLRYLPEDLWGQVRDLAFDADLETLYTAAKFAAAREDCRTTHPLLRDAREPKGANGDESGLFTITGELTGSHDPAIPGGEQRASAISMIPGVNRPSAPPHEEGARQLDPDRRQEGFQDRQARPVMAFSRGPPRPYAPRTRYGFGEAPGRNRGHPARGPAPGEVASGSHDVLCLWPDRPPVDKLR